MPPKNPEKYPEYCIEKTEVTYWVIQEDIFSFVDDTVQVHVYGYATAEDAAENDKTKKIKSQIVNVPKIGNEPQIEEETYADAVAEALGGNKVEIE